MDAKGLLGSNEVTLFTLSRAMAVIKNSKFERQIPRVYGTCNNLFID